MLYFLLLDQLKCLDSEMEIFESSIFDLSPIPMWLEDYSEVK